MEEDPEGTETTQREGLEKREEVRGRELGEINGRRGRKRLDSGDR